MASSIDGNVISIIEDSLVRNSDGEILHFGMSNVIRSVEKRVIELQNQLQSQTHQLQYLMAQKEDIEKTLEVILM